MASWSEAWPLAAATLGAPGESLAEVLDTLAATGALLLELRCGGDQLAGVQLRPEQRRRLRDQLHAAGVRVLTASSYVKIGSLDDDASLITDLLAHAQLAADLDASYLRIFPGGPQHPRKAQPRRDEDGPTETDERIVRRLATTAGAMRELGVRPLLETHDSHPRGQDVARVLAELDLLAPEHQVGAIWDVHHPLLAGESPGDTAGWLGRHLLEDRGYLQIKDVQSLTDVTPVAPGEGQLPLSEVFDAAIRIGYTGPVSLEWERAWHPQVETMQRPLAVTAAWLDRKRRHAERSPGSPT